MSHDALIQQLSAQLKPVSVLRPAGYAARMGALWLATLLAIVASIGLRSDLGVAPVTYLKPAFFAAMMLLLGGSLYYGALPARRNAGWLVGAGVVALMGLAALMAEMTREGLQAAQAALTAPNSLACLLSVTLFGLVSLFWMMRWLQSAAPCRPICAGMGAGMVSGALAASAYGLHCQQDAMAYIAIWYVGAVLMLAALGALWGHKTLRW